MAAESPTSMASTVAPAMMRADQASYAVTIEILRPSDLKRAKSWTLCIGPHKRGIDGVEPIPFERLEIRADRLGVSAREGPAEGMVGVGEEVRRHAREVRVRRRGRDPEAALE